jgi:hypothetical protein
VLKVRFRPPEYWGVSMHERRRDPARTEPRPFGRRRRSERVVVDLQARIADSPTIVDLHDLTPEGVAFDSPVALELGTRVVLLTRICNAEGVRRDIALPVVTRWVRHGHRIHHVGAEFAGVDDATRTLLAEYCALVAPSHRHHVTH